MIEKVVDKLVRVVCKDGREYLAILKCLDKSGALFVQDGLEIIDTDFDNPECLHLWHDLYTPYLLNYFGQEKKVFKYLGNIVIMKKDIAKILIDKQANAFFDDMVNKCKNKEFLVFEAKINGER